LVKTYRLVGYENRMLNKEDFANDSIDAGDVGAGHTVTAMYEVVLRKPGDQTDPGLQAMNHPGTSKSPEVFCGELMRLNMRYKKPLGRQSSLITWAIPHVPLKAEETSTNFRWAAAVASFGMMLRQSEYVQSLDYAQLLELAQGAGKPDPDGEKQEFIGLVRKAQQLSAAATASQN
jgi:Ca-activated chloride channel family protein